MTESNDEKLIEVYNTYILENTNDTSHLINGNEVKISDTNKMGYVSSVEEARKTLENLFKDSQ